jgi:hypothetical protein
METSMAIFGGRQTTASAPKWRARSTIPVGCRSFRRPHRQKVDTSFLPMLLLTSKTCGEADSFRMTRANHLLRFFLILVLSAGGAVNAWAATHMALENIEHAAAAKATAGAAADCEEDSQAGGSGNETGSGLQHDCDCGGQSACACSCALTFFPDNAPVPFAAQHALASVYAGRLKSLTARHDISPVFRPPIG